MVFDTLYMIDLKELEALQTLYFYIDDSGTLHKNERSGLFVYAGYLFLKRLHRDNAQRRYRAAVKTLQSRLGRNDELKAHGLRNKDRRFLFNSIKQCRSFSSIVRIERVYDRILVERESICRYKDYVLKRVIKEKLGYLISLNLVNPAEDIQLIVQIDEQLNCSNGYYSLESSIREELSDGIYNYDYGVMHPPLFLGKVDVKVSFSDSSNNYLIQASDILANKIWNDAKNKVENIEGLTNHKNLFFP